MNRYIKILFLCQFAFISNAFAGPGDPFNGIDVSLIDKSTGSAVAVDGNATMLIDKSTGSAVMTTNLQFFGTAFIFHDMTLLGPGIYTIDTGADGGPETGIFNFEVAAGQLGLHSLVDWGNNINMDLVNVWDDTGTSLLDTDWDGDGLPGGAFAAGSPFAGSTISINVPSTVVPLPSAIILFVSGLAGIAWNSKRKRV